MKRSIWSNPGWLALMALFVFTHALWVSLLFLLPGVGWLARTWVWFFGAMLFDWLYLVIISYLPGIEQDA